MLETIIMAVEMLLIYVLLGIANIGTGMHYNINIKKMKFDWSKLGDGLLKLFVIGISILIGTVCIALLPRLFQAAGIEISNMEDITVKAVFLIVVSGITTYALKFIENLKKIFEKESDK